MLVIGFGEKFAIEEMQTSGYLFGSAQVNAMRDESAVKLAAPTCSSLGELTRSTAPVDGFRRNRCAGGPLRRFEIDSGWRPLHQARIFIEILRDHPRFPAVGCYDGDV